MQIKRNIYTHSAVINNIDIMFCPSTARSIEGEGENEGEEIKKNEGGGDPVRWMRNSNRYHLGGCGHGLKWSPVKEVHLFAFSI